MLDEDFTSLDLSGIHRFSPLASPKNVGLGGIAAALSLMPGCIGAQSIALSGCSINTERYFVNPYEITVPVKGFPSR